MLAIKKRPNIPTAGFGTYTSDGDVILGNFNIIEEGKNWLILHKVKRNVVKGEFKVNLGRIDDYETDLFRYPDTITMEGSFVAERWKD